MSNTNGIPESLGTAAVGAAFAALGFVAKLVWDRFVSSQKAEAAKRAHLLELCSLLRASRVVFLKQIELTNRLIAELFARDPSLRGDDQEGLDEMLSRCFHLFTPEERDLHSVIRGYTEYAVGPLNSEMLGWVRRDRDFRTAKGTGGKAAALLAAQINQLDIHLTMWDAKCRAWMRDPKHALVFLASEVEHGVGFPHGLDVAVDRWLLENSVSMPVGKPVQ